MSVELQVLRTAKAAVDEGLLQPEDYTVVKEAFMKALAIKGGVDSGFLGQTDFAEARKQFFGSLGMTGLAGAAASKAPAAGPQQSPASTPRDSGTDAGKQGATSTKNGRTPAVTPPRPAVPATETARAPAVLSIPDGATGTAGTTPTGPETTPKSAAATPGGISDRGGGAAAVASKKSMAGISIHADSVNVVWELRVKKAYRWVLFQIAGSGKEVVIESTAQPESTWAEFVAAVPDSQCRYGVFDYKYVNSEGTEFGKLVFLSWAPENAPVKAKMQHASTKDLFRGLLEGVSVEVHATDVSELSEEAVREQVAATIKIK